MANLISSVSGIPLDQSLQQITRLLQSEFERHENALAEIEHVEKHRQASLPYPSRPGLPTLGLPTPGTAESSALSSFSLSTSSPHHHHSHPEDVTGSPSPSPSSSSSASSSSSSTRPPRRSDTSNGSSGGNSQQQQSEEFGTMFLNAALALIEKASEQNRGASNSLGGHTLSKEYAPEVVKMGILRKGRGTITRSMTRQPRWTPKQVVLCPGRFTYYNLKKQSQSIGQLFGSHMSEELSQSQLLAKGDNSKNIDITKCSVKAYHFRDTNSNLLSGSESGGNESCFMILGRKTAGGESGDIKTSLWMAQDANDRQRWIQAIRTASRLTSVTATLKEDSAHCVYVRQQIQECETKEHYLAALSSLLSPRQYSNSNGRVRVPIEWLRKEKQNMASIRNDMTMEQATKDLLRDMFELNGVLHEGDKGLVAIIGTLAGNIMNAARNANIVFSEASALTFAREVLYNSNRTQFGGDGYEAVDLICCNAELVFATPLGQVAAPIQIQVTTDGSAEENGGEDEEEEEDDEDQHVFLSVLVTADMTFNMNVLDPTDDDEMVWSKVYAKFERTFVWAGDRAVALGSGAIWCSI